MNNEEYYWFTTTDGGNTKWLICKNGLEYAGVVIDGYGSSHLLGPYQVKDDFIVLKRHPSIFREINVYEE